MPEDRLQSAVEAAVQATAEAKAIAVRVEATTTATHAEFFENARYDAYSTWIMVAEGRILGSMRRLNDPRGFAHVTVTDEWTRDFRENVLEPTRAMAKGMQYASREYDLLTDAYRAWEKWLDDPDDTDLAERGLDAFNKGYREAQMAYEKWRDSK